MGPLVDKNQPNSTTPNDDNNTNNQCNSNGLDHGSNNISSTTKSRSKNNVITSSNNNNNNEVTTTTTATGTTTTINKPFKQRRSFETRKLESENVRKKFPTKIPVVVERYQREVSMPEMDKSKFLVPQELTMMNFAIIIKQRLNIPSSRAFYFVIDNQSMVSTSKTIAEVYREHKDPDGFLYMTYASQEMFG